MRKRHDYLPATLDALSALGAQIGVARRELGWSSADLADRLGVGAAVVSRIEQGVPGTSVGTVLEAAVLCGVPLFGVDATELHTVAEHTRTRLALLPQRVRVSAKEIPDDF